MTALLETQFILCFAVVMTLVARILRRGLIGSSVSEKYKRQQQERHQQQATVNSFRHVSLRKVHVEVEVMVQNERVHHTPRSITCQYGPSDYKIWLFITTRAEDNAARTIRLRRKCFSRVAG